MHPCSTVHDPINGRPTDAVLSRELHSIDVVIAEPLTDAAHLIVGQLGERRTFASGCALLDGHVAHVDNMVSKEQVAEARILDTVKCVDACLIVSGAGAHITGVQDGFAVRDRRATGENPSDTMSNLGTIADHQLPVAALLADGASPDPATRGFVNLDLRAESFREITRTADGHAFSATETCAAIGDFKRLRKEWGSADFAGPGDRRLLPFGSATLLVHSDSPPSVASPAGTIGAGTSCVNYTSHSIAGAA